MDWDRQHQRGPGTRKQELAYQENETQVANVRYVPPPLPPSGRVGYSSSTQAQPVYSSGAEEVVGGSSSGASGSVSQQNPILGDSADGQPAADKQPSPDDDGDLIENQIDKNVEVYKVAETLKAEVAKLKIQMNPHRIFWKKLQDQRGSSSGN